MKGDEHPTYAPSVYMALLYLYVYHEQCNVVSSWLILAPLLRPCWVRIQCNYNVEVTRCIYIGGGADAL